MEKILVAHPSVYSSGFNHPPPRRTRETPDSGNDQCQKGDC